MSLLNYFQDKDGNYIIRRVFSEETGEDYFVYNGTFSSNYIFKKENLEEKVGNKFEELSNEIEKNVYEQYKVGKDSILFEKIIGNFVDETKYNPLFEMMTKEEVLEMQGESIKVKINLTFEFNIRVEKHLQFKALKEYIFGNSQEKNN